MACYHPLKAFPIGLTDNGKPQYKICSYDANHVEKYRGQWLPSRTQAVAPNCSDFVREFVEIPCGQCIGCRLDYSRMWANRCLLELQYHKSSFFVTLTYDDEHLPLTFFGEPETGEAHPAATLRKADFQKFMKRLRRNTGQGLRFFAAGEYGSKTFRPHYHAIIFGLELDDLQVYKCSPQGFTYYTSETMQKAWPLGFVVVGDVSWETCAYTARYICKKLKGQESVFYDLHNIEPEFSLMSRKPGIGRQYFDDHPELFQYDFLNVPTEKGGKKFRPPRYFAQLYEKDHPDFVEKKVFLREHLEGMKSIKLDSSSKDYLGMLADEESALINRTKSLERKCI